MNIIGITGYARSGKDTAAKILGELAGYKRIALADRLKEGMFQLNPIVRADAYGRTYRVADIVEDLGWEEAKAIPEVRALLQRFGTDCCRSMFGNDIWVNALSEEIWDRWLAGEGADWVVPDVRFDNEAAVLRDRGARIIRIDREGVGPLNGHASEDGVDPSLIDYVVDNSGDLQHLTDGLRGVLEDLGVLQAAAA